MKTVATMSLPAVNRPNADRWNAARSCQYFENTYKSVDITFVLDTLWRIVNPNFVMMQQKNFVA